MKIKLALASHNTEKCFENKVFALESQSSKIAKRLLELNPGDILVFYKSQAGFAGIWEVTSNCYNDDKPIWEDGKYPARVDIKPILKLEKDQYLKIQGFVDELKMIKHKHYWFLSLRENLSDIPKEDYELIKSKLEKQVHVSAK